MANNYDNEDGVWRTIGGRRVFIKKGQSLSDAMKESGKFSRVAKNQDLYKKLDEESKKDQLKEEIEDKFGKINDENYMKAQNFLVMDKNMSVEDSEKILGNYKDYLDKDSREFLEKNERLNKAIGSTEGRENLQNKANEVANKMSLEKYNELYDKKVYDEGMSEKQFKKLYGERPTEEKETLNAWQKRKQELLNGVSQEAERDKEDYEYNLYKQARTNPESINPMTENSTDWEELDKKYKDRYEKENKKEETFIQKSTNPFYPDREYSKEDLERMEKNGVRPKQNSYSGNGWEGVNSHKNLTTSEQAKEITDTMKKKYPDVKIARRSDVYSGGSSIDFNIMSSSKDLFVSDADIDKMGDNRDFDRLTTTYDFERWANDNVKGYRENHTYTLDDQKKYAKETLTNLKKRDVQSVRGNEWYLSDYGKKVVSDLNTTADSYTYDDSDAMTDYFNHGTYMHISIGKWDKPYQVNEKNNGGNQITNALKNTAYKNYMKQHPNSKMTLEEFKNR